MSRFRWLRTLVMVFGAAWFLPISCTTGTYVGTQVFSAMDARDVSIGGKPHTLFHVVVRQPATASTVRALPLSEAEALRPTEDHSFLMRAASGVVTLGKWHQASYRVIDTTAGRQTLEVTYSDDDREVIGLYRATEKTVAPLRSQLMAPAFMFAALPYAFGFSLLLMTAAKLVLRRMNRATMPRTDT